MLKILVMCVLFCLPLPALAFTLGDFESKQVWFAEQYLNNNPDAVNIKTHETTYGSDYRFSFRGFTKYKNLVLYHNSWLEYNEGFGRMSNYQLAETLGYTVVNTPFFKLSPIVSYQHQMQKTEQYRAGIRIEF